MIEQKCHTVLPFKSVAAALLFSLVLGPVGLLYASVLGGITMMLVGLLICHTQLIVPIVLVWLMSCVWSVVAVNRYNKKILMHLM